MNGDGRLTFEQIRAYPQKLRGQAAPDNLSTQRGAQSQFEVDSGWDRDRFHDHAICYRSSQEMKAIYTKTVVAEDFVRAEKRCGFLRCERIN